MNAMNLENVTLVGHDWGAALAWEYARRNPHKVKRLAFMEGVLPPIFPRPTFESMSEEMGNMFRAFRDPVQGQELVIKGNMFIEEVLPQFVDRELGKTAMNFYRRPFLNENDRAPVLVWPREVPIEGSPESTIDVMNAVGTFMGETTMPVLLVYVSPGVLVPPQAVPWYVSKIANLETVYAGQGFHFFQEDQPEATGRAIADWLRRN